MLYGVLALLVQAWCVLQLRIEKRDAEISENREQAEKARQQMLQEQQLRRLQMQYVLECVRACVPHFISLNALTLRQFCFRLVTMIFVRPKQLTKYIGSDINEVCPTAGAWSTVRCIRRVAIELISNNNKVVRIT